jgi:uncharacterized membrane protein
MTDSPDRSRGDAAERCSERCSVDPMFVEGATQEVGQFIATNPLYFAVTDALAVGLVVGILAMSSGTAVFVMTV